MEIFSKIRFNEFWKKVLLAVKSNEISKLGLLFINFCSEIFSILNNNKQLFMVTIPIAFLSDNNTVPEDNINHNPIDSINTELFPDILQNKDF